jgi:hypothetical protein
MLNDIKEFGRKATAEHKAKLSAGMLGNNKGFRRQTEIGVAVNGF